MVVGGHFGCRKSTLFHLSCLSPFQIKKVDFSTGWWWSFPKFETTFLFAFLGTLDQYAIGIYLIMSASGHFRLVIGE